MSSNVKEFNLGELFCGPGGMAYGAYLAKKQVKNKKVYSIKHVWGVDKDGDAIDTYKHNIAKESEAVGYHEDVNVFCKKKLKECTPINALAFGFPCNDFSIVGQQRGTKGRYGMLYKAGIKVINKFDPYWFVAENVSGIHSANDGKAFKKIINELENSGNFGGYNLTINLYKFEEYGIPQYRHRYLIVGIRKDQGVCFEVPKITHLPPEKINSENEKEFKPFMTSVEALDGIDPKNKLHVFAKNSPKIKERLMFTPPWRNAWYLDEMLCHKNDEEMFRNYLKDLPWYEDKFAKRSLESIVSRIENVKLNCKKARMSHIYKRLDADKPSYTITGSGGGGTHVYHWEDPRALTNRERARLQSFEDEFHFKGSRESVRKQIGMAVPPKAAKIIFEAILKTFAGKKYPCQPPTHNGDYFA